MLGTYNGHTRQICEAHLIVDVKDRIRDLRTRNRDAKHRVSTSANPCRGLI